LIKEGQEKKEIARQSGQGGNRYRNINEANISKNKPKTLTEVGLTPHQRVFCYLKSF